MTPNRVAIDGDTVERDLVKLVLTIVEVLRQLMERQALRRVDEGDLTEDQEERIGVTLMLLEDRMGRLRERYRLSDQDLNLDLGPLGPLLPADHPRFTVGTWEGQVLEQPGARASLLTAPWRPSTDAAP